RRTCAPCFSNSASFSGVRESSTRSSAATLCSNNLAAALPNWPDAPVTMILPMDPLLCLADGARFAPRLLAANNNECYGCGNIRENADMKLAIEDRLALQDLFADYSWALDTGDEDGL